MQETEPMRYVREACNLVCDRCGSRLHPDQIPNRQQGYPRTGEYVRGSWAFARCGNVKCSAYDKEIDWALIPFIHLGVQERSLGGSTYDGRRVLPDQGERRKERTIDTSAGYYGDEIQGCDRTDDSPQPAKRRKLWPDYDGA